MSKRSKARQVAVQMLFQVDLNPDVDGRMIRDMIAERMKDAELKDFAWWLFAGVMEHRPELDEKIQAAAEKWTLNRMAGTDRAVLRMGAFELLKTPTPAGVVIDEAIEQAKKFGSSQSSVFVNGILDKLVPAEKRRRPSRQPVQPVESSAPAEGEAPQETAEEE